MCGWFSAAIVRASRSNLRRSASLWRYSTGSVLIATVRSSRVSTAL